MQRQKERMKDELRPTDEMMTRGELRMVGESSEIDFCIFRPHSDRSLLREDLRIEVWFRHMTRKNNGQYLPDIPLPLQRQRCQPLS